VWNIIEFGTHRGVPMDKYIYESEIWPDFTWNEALVSPLLSRVRYMQGILIGRLDALGFAVRNRSVLNSISEEIQKSSAVEGEILSPTKVRSSVARRLGIVLPEMHASDHITDAIVDMMMDATQNYDAAVTDERLFGWHSALFPAGRSGPYRIRTGEYRMDEMQIVSGAFGKEVVHYNAPLPEKVPGEMHAFIQWLNKSGSMDPVIKAALAHLRFVTIHPFDDGNGRIGRALTELLLARAEASGLRYYSMSSQLMKDQNAYYSVLEDTQHGYGDVTDWLVWFINCLCGAIEDSQQSISQAIQRNAFWEFHSETAFNARQRKMIEKFIEGFEGSLRTSKWARMTNCSQDTALRDITDLINKGVLAKDESGGRSTSYALIYPKSNGVE
jgi:Fic family protein